MTDTTFALAYYRMSMAAEWNADQRLGLRMAAIANRHAQRLSTKDSELVRAHYDMLRGAADSAERRYRAILEDSPDEVEAWLKVGEILFHNNPARGRPLKEAEAPFERVLAYDRTHRAALLHLARIAAAERQLDRVDSLVRRYLALNISDGSLGMRLLAASSAGDTATVRRLAGSAATETDEAITDAARDALMFARNPDAAIQILRVNLAMGRGSERNAVTHLQIAAVELGRGGGPAAQASFAQAARHGYAETAVYLETLYALAVGSNNAGELDSLRQRVAAVVVSAAPRSARVPLLTLMLSGSAAIRASLLAELSLALGDTAASSAYLKELASAPTSPGFEWMRDELLVVTRARMALRRGRAEEALAELRLFRHPDDVPLNRGFPWYALLRLTQAEALSALGRDREAAPLWSSFEHQSLFLTPFVATAQLRAARTSG